MDMLEPPEVYDSYCEAAAVSVWELVDVHVTDPTDQKTRGVT